MDLTWLALSVGTLAMPVVVFLVCSIADCVEIGDKPFGNPERQTVRIELLIERSCPRGFLAP